MATIQGVAGINLYPALAEITNLFRNLINDDMSGATNTPGEGNIATNGSPFLLNFLNRAMRDLYSDLRLVADPMLVFDNYILTGLPVVNSGLGFGVPNATTQVSLGYNGFFDGVHQFSQFTLPSYCAEVERMWERATGTYGDFTPMQEAPFGISGTQQGSSFGVWEARQGAIWMPGAVTQRDLRIRGTMLFANFVNIADSLDFENTFFPVMDSANAVVDKMLVLYARRFAPDQYMTAKDAAAESLGDLKQEIVRRKQTIEFSRQDFGGDISSSLANQL